MTDKEGEEVPCLRKTKGGLHDSALSLVIIEVNHTEGRPKKHLEQVSTVLLADEQLRVRVNVLHRLGIRNHKVLFLRNQVTNCNMSRLKIMYSEEAMKLEHLPVPLLSLEVGFAGLFEVKICEVPEERVTLPRAWDI